MSSEPTDNPLQFGEIVVSFAEAKFRYGARKNDCPHDKLLLDDHGEIVECGDCKKQVGTYWAFSKVLQGIITKNEKLLQERRALKTDRETVIHTAAAKRVEEAWRRRKHAPMCPHCSRGIFATDGFGGSSIDKDFELARRAREIEERRAKRESNAPTQPPTAPNLRVIS